MIADALVFDLKVASIGEVGELTMREIDHWLGRIELRRKRKKT